MTTTLNASTAGAGGFIATSDNSGVLALQTAGTTAITVDASQNVGIGTTTIATIDVTGKTLEVYGGAGGGFIHMTNSTTGQTASDGFIIGTSIGGSAQMLHEAIPSLHGANSLLATRRRSAGPSY